MAEELSLVVQPEASLSSFVARYNQLAKAEIAAEFSHDSDALAVAATGLDRLIRANPDFHTDLIAMIELDREV